MHVSAVLIVLLRLDAQPTLLCKVVTLIELQANTTEKSSSYTDVDSPSSSSSGKGSRRSPEQHRRPRLEMAGLPG